MPVMLYSSEVRLPMHTTAVMHGHQHTHQTAPFGCEQDRADGSHPEGQGLCSCLQEDLGFCEYVAGSSLWKT
jgi:hypothetical protein